MIPLPKVVRKMIASHKKTIGFYPGRIKTDGSSNYRVMYKVGSF